MIKSKTVTSDLNIFNGINKTPLSFYNFNLLLLNGEQQLLSFGQYSEKGGTKENRKKIIQYQYLSLIHI